MHTHRRDYILLELNEHNHLKPEEEKLVKKTKKNKVSDFHINFDQCFPILSLIDLLVLVFDFSFTELIL